MHTRTGMSELCLTVTSFCTFALQGLRRRLTSCRAGLLPQGERVQQISYLHCGHDPSCEGVLSCQCRDDASLCAIWRESWLTGPLSGAGFHLPSHVSDFGKGHTLDLAFIMEERRHELAYLHRQENTLAQPGARGQVSIQPVITPGETPITLHSMLLGVCGSATTASV